MTVTRRGFLWAVGALLGIALTVALTWSVSRLAAQRIGLSSEPLSVVHGLTPPHGATVQAAPSERASRDHERKREAGRVRRRTAGGTAVSATAASATAASATAASATAAPATAAAVAPSSTAGAATGPTTGTASGTTPASRPPSASSAPGGGQHDDSGDGPGGSGSHSASGSSSGSPRDD